MIRQIILGSMLLLSIITISACGGGGGSVPLIIAPPTSATVKISLNGSLGSSAISGTDFIVTLPANVTPATTSGTTVAANVVTLSGTFAGSTLTPQVIYTPAAGATHGTLQIIAPNAVPTGVTTVGEIATIVLQLANGATPVAADFPLSSISVFDTLYATIAGMSASVSRVTLQ